MKEVVIVDGVRTPQAIFGGALKELSAAHLGEAVVKELLKRTKIDTKLIEEVIFGCVGQTSDAPNVARVIALRSGVPRETPGFTVQRNCASGLQAIVSAWMNIQTGERDLQIAGGTESMSMAPYINRDLRFGKHLRNSEMVDSLWEGLTDPVCGQVMGRTAENIAEEFKISREEQDRFAILSHKRAFKATREGRFKDEMVTVMVPKKLHGKELPPEPFAQDEGINVALNEETLALYPTIFKEGGTVTPGNSCPISDGAACVLIMSYDKAQELGFKPMGFIRSFAFAGVEPNRMGIGPTKSMPLALKKAGLELKDIQLFEVNEAFAATYLATEKILGLNRDIVNVNGGAIALGHPVGTTGCRLVITLLNEMKKRDLKYGIATMCVGGGQGGTVVLERR